MDEDEMVEPETPPAVQMSVAEIVGSIRARHDATERRLVELRDARAALNAQIRTAVAERDQLRRFLRAGEPRRRGRTATAPAATPARARGRKGSG